MNTKNTEFANLIKNCEIEKMYVFTNKDGTLLDALNILPGNRPIKKERIGEIKEAFKNNEFIPPILVTLPYRFITEGNHRYMAAQECLKEGIPFKLRVYFYKDENALATARIINNTQKRWTANDRLASYCFENKEDYILLRDFMDEYNGIFKNGVNYSVSSALCILAKSRAKNSMLTSFSSGKLKIKKEHIEFGHTIMTELAAISSILNNNAPYRKDNSTGWIKARTRLGISFPVFLSRLKKKSTTFVCPNQTAKAWFDFYISVAGGF